MKKTFTLWAIYLISVFILTGCESLNNGFWSKEKKFLDADGQVHLCSEKFSHISSVEECLKCRNERTIFTWDGKSYCGLKNCPDGMFQDIYDGNCFNCSEVKSYTSTAQECAKCGNMREMFSDGKYDFCALICSKGSFRSTSGICVSCMENRAVIAGSEECNRCDGLRKMIADKDGNFCGLTNCPDKTFRSGVACVPCSDKDYNVASFEECSKCGKTRRAFLYKGKNVCAPSFLSDCEEGSFHALDGRCIPCIDDSLDPNNPNAPISVPATTSEECAKCKGIRKIITYKESDWCVPIKSPKTDGHMLHGFIDEAGSHISL